MTIQYKPYVSLDIETTGITDQDQVLQIGLVVDDLVSPIESLKQISFFVDNSNRLYTGYLDAEAISMNAWIFEYLAGKKRPPYPLYPYEQAVIEFHNVLVDVAHKTGRSIYFAGKNVATFDLRLLRANGFLDEATLKGRGVEISHRTIDTGSLYLPDFGYVPTSNELNKFIGRDPVSHDALTDALDTVCAIRTKMKIGV